MLAEEPTLPFDASSGDLELGGQCGRYRIEGHLGAGGMGIVLAAHDPVLDRRVALKLLRPNVERVGADRIEREAQAMARLAHPNVVTVFEVDRVGDRTFIAMELVEGATLRGWLAARPRSWREIVTMFVATGRGLAAAHAAGLVHRDFKPENVLIDRAGRPRVSDFGLVHETGDPQLPSADAGVDITARGTVLGTPAYMSPEQWAGGPVDARGDQFAFCVALWEALWDVRPFVGTTPLVLRASVQAGELVEPSGRRVPRRLQTALRRGLAVDPAERWSDLPALLDVLERATLVRRRWVVAAVAASAAVASAVVATAILTTRSAADPCAPPADRLAQVWPAPRRAALAATLVAADPARGAERFAKLAPALDSAAAGWSAMHVEACRATRVEGRQSDTLLDRRMTCLDRWLAELAATIGTIEQARDPAAVDNATHAAMSLSPLGACADLAALADAVPPPADLARRTLAESLARRTRELDVAQRAGRFAGVAERATELVAEARRLDHPPALAAALTVQARIAYGLGDEVGGEAIVRELAQVASRAKDDRAAAFAWTNLIQTLGRAQGKPDAALALVPVASAAVLRAGDPADLRADLLQHHAMVVDFGAHPEQGLELLLEARRVLEAAGAAAAGSPLESMLADVLLETGTSHARLRDTAGAVASYREAIAHWQALYGADSADEAYAWQNLGATYQQAGKLDDALAAFQTALRIRRARLGDAAMTATSAIAVASVLDTQDKFEQAHALYDEAVAIDRARLAPGDLELARALIGRATAARHLDHLDDAARDYDAAIATYERGAAKTVDFATALFGRARVATARGDCDAALRDLARSIALVEELRGRDAERLVFPLVAQARCLLRQGKLAEAAAPLDHALALPAATTNPFSRAVARAYLGVLRVRTGTDPAGGRAAFAAARAEILTDVTGPELVHEIEQWLR